MILSPSRGIVLPSLGSFIDRVRRNFAPIHMMAHLKKDPVTGHLVKNAAGHLVNECGSIPCSNCSGATPGSLALSISGWTASCCPLTFTRRAPLGTINGTWTLAQVGACTWQYDDMSIGAGVYNLADTTCTGTHGSDLFGTRFRMDVSGTTWTLSVSMVPLGVPRIDSFFNGILVTAWDCQTGTISIPNLQFACDGNGSGGLYLGSGGTGVITPL